MGLDDIQPVGLLHLLHFEHRRHGGSRSE
jgi:hypothetical protein